MRGRGCVLGLLLVAATAVMAGQAFGQVEQVRLGLNDESPSDSLIVSWYEQVPTPSDPEVTVTGPEGDEQRYAAEQVPGPAAGVVYEAAVTGLSPDTAYAYQVADGFEGTFTTPPSNLTDGEQLRIVALGDMGITERSQNTVDTIRELGPDVVLHMGDLSYGEGDQTVWNQWFEMTEPVAAEVPWLPAIGNHETLPPVTEVVYFEQRFALPNNERWYSFDWAGVHIVALDTYSQSGYPYTGDQLWEYDEQLAWLEQDLAEHADATWTLVFLHEAPYSSNRHGPSERVQAAFDGVFEEHGVDLVLAGHDHGYERTFPLLGGAPQSHDPDNYTEGEGVIHVVSGAAGQSLYTGWTDDPPDWSVTRNSLYHVFEMTITQQAIQGRMVPTEGDSFEDTFTLQKAPVTREGEGDPVEGATAGTPGPGAAVLVVVGALGAMVAAKRRRA